jgi:hypothetical protein
MSAPDSGKAWDLRCYVREALIAYLQQNHPQSLPRLRADISGLPQAENSTALLQTASRAPEN